MPSTMTRYITILTTLLLMSLTACVNRGHGLHNLGAVEMGVLYRSGEPENQMAVRTLRSMGINTVIDLRSCHEVKYAESNWCSSYGIDYIRIPMNGLMKVEDSKLRRLKTILFGMEIRKPILIHCVYGSDRTGVACAWYQTLVGIPKDTIMREAEEYGLLVPAMKHQIEEMKP